MNGRSSTVADSSEKIKISREFKKSRGMHIREKERVSNTIENYCKI